MIKIAVLVLHVLTAVSVCGLVLLQHGKGADMGAAFGSGSSGSLFGASGSANFLSRTTAVLAAVFFVTSMGLTWISTQTTGTGSVMEAHPVEQPAAPAVPEGTSVPPAAPATGDSKSQEIPK